MSKAKNLKPTPAPPLQKEGTKELRHAEFISASHDEPSPELLCAKHDKNLSTYRFNVLKTDKTPSLTTSHKRYSIVCSAESPGEGKGFTLAEVFSPCRKVKLDFGFTLAEVLITLGIIGIVAAVTLPSVIHKFQAKVLQSQFKVADTIINESVQYVYNEFGIDSSAKSYSSYCRNGACVDNGVAKEMNEYWIKVLTAKGATQPKPYANFAWGIGYDKDASYSFIFPGTWYTGLDNKPLYIMKNGILISPIQMLDGWLIGVDINGPKRGPNIIGVDIFMWGDQHRNRSWKNECKLYKEKMTQPDWQQRGCYNYAKLNQYPYDTSKGYWEGLKW